jgi:uncharacterized membrane protein
MATSNPTIIHALQTIGITSASLVAGSNFATSLYAIPAILHSPPKLLAKQWLELYNRGIVVVVPLGIASTASFGYLAYTASSKVGFMSSSTAQLYATAAALAIGNMVFTRIAIMPTNNALMEIAKSGSEAGVEKTVDLVKKWDGLNMTRGCLVFAATVLGTWLTASRPL